MSARLLSIASCLVGVSLLLAAPARAQLLVDADAAAPGVQTATNVPRGQPVQGAIVLLSGGQAVAGFDILLTFDVHVLQLRSAQLVGIAAGAYQLVSASLPGSAQIAAALVGPAQMSNGAILNVTFDTIGTGTTPITVTSQKVSAAAGAMLSYTSSGATVTVTSIFTDDPVFARFTPIRARHVTELRSLIDAKRIARGLGAFPWTDPSPAVVRTVHIVELRAALAAVYVAAGQQPPSYTDPTLTAKQTTVRAVHINELRTALVNAP